MVLLLQGVQGVQGGCLQHERGLGAGLGFLQREEPRRHEGLGSGQVQLAWGWGPERRGGGGRQQENRLGGRDIYRNDFVV